MELRTLEKTTLENLTAVFNDAFRDYFIPLQFTPEDMAVKMTTEGICPAYSIGAFAGDQLVGFMLHGYDLVNGVKTVYNGGTGVIPSHRGRGLTGSMYRYAVPLLMRAGIYDHLLEVIDSNVPAIRAYKSAGFQPVRQLAAFKSTVTLHGNAAADIRTITAIPSEPAFAGMQPTWQNSTASLHRGRASHQAIGAFENGLLVGYAAYVPAAGRVKQFAVHANHRRKGIGTALFRHMQQNSGKGSLLVTNIDKACMPVVAFLEALQFQPFLPLCEMKLVIKP